MVSNGLKKPLNMLEGPIYADIRRGPPRFVNSGKAWNVDVGRTMIETSHIPQFYAEPNVLVQSRDYNSQHAYGKSSFKDVINDHYRPPLITMEDNMPMTRIPRPIVVPNINPGTAHESGTNAFSAQNSTPSGIDSKLTDRIKTKEWMPTFYAPLDMPQDNAILPDLEVKVPSYSASAGFVFPQTFAPPPQEVKSDFQKLEPILDSGTTTQLVFDYPSSLQDLELETKMPNVSVTSGKEYPYNSTFNVIDYELENNRPDVSVSAGYNSGYTTGIAPVEHDLYYTRPQVSVSAGLEYDLRTGLTPQEYILEDNRPKYAVSTGYHNPFNAVDNIRSNPTLDQKLFVEPTIINPTMIYREDNKEIQATKIGNNRPMPKYEIPPESRYTTEGCLSQKPGFRTKKSALSSYKSYNTEGYVPRTNDFGKVGLQNVHIKTNRPKMTYSIGRKVVA